MKILVVDDSPTTRGIIRQELEAGGYAVVEAENGIQALTRVAVPPVPALITLDIEMPKLNGFETCAKLREERYTRLFPDSRDGRIPIVFVTGNDTLEDRKRGFELGAADFITKPFTRGELLETVDTILKPEEHLQGMTALVVDDSRLARSIVRESLEQRGLAIVEAEDGADAYELLNRRRDEIDIVVTDLVMERMDGDELCTRIRRELGLRQLPVIVLTALPDASRLLELFKAGATDYLVKPFAKEELLARLDVHIASSRLNRRLRAAVDELRGLNQMKDDLLAICSHDLRSPLNGILGFADLLQEKEYLEEEDRERLGLLRQSGEYLMSLINDILDLAKLESNRDEMQMEPISLFSILQASVNALRHLAVDKGQRLDVSSACARDAIMGNRNAMIRVVNNLLSNAVKFTPENGSIELRIESAAKDQIAVAIADTGIGIDAEKIPHLFERFTQTSRTGTGGELGTGLGLSIVKEIVDRHGGRIEVTSTKGEGSCFKLTFPRTEASPADAAPVGGTVAPPQAVTEPMDRIPGSRILLAEDNHLNARIAEATLKRFGCLVTVAGNGRSACQAVQKEEFDLVLMDLHMPEMDGLEATRCIRGELGLEDLPIIALTASVDEREVEACRAAGMNDYLSKPIDKKALTATLREWISAG